MTDRGSRADTAVAKRLIGGVKASAFGVVMFRVSPALVSLALARIAGPGSLGALAYALSILNLAWSVGDLGVSIALPRCAAEYQREGDVALSGLAIRLIAATAAGGTLLALHVGRSYSQSLVLWIVAALIATTFDLVPVVLNATLKFVAGAVTQTLASGVFLVGGIVTAAVGFPVAGPLVSRAVGSVVAGLPKTTRWISDGGRPRWHLAKYLLRYGSIAMVPGLMSTIFNQTDIIVIANSLGYISAGVYKAAATIATAPAILSAILATPLQPLIASQDAADRDAVVKLVVRSVDLLVVVAAGALAIGAVCAASVLEVVAGKPYVVGATAMILLLSGNLLGLINTPLLSLLLMTGRAFPVAAVATGAALLNVTLNLVLIPRWGLAGGGFASVVCYAFSLACELILTCSPSGRWPSFGKTVEAVLFGAAAYLLARGAVEAVSNDQPALRMTVGIVVAAAAYGAFLYVRPPLTKTDWESLLRVFRQRGDQAR
jgi:O-antigen/teichoic acid export membrane protein